MERWTDYVETITGGLAKVEVTDRSGAPLAADAGVAAWVQLTRAAHDRGAQIYIIGNGGSAGLASHLAADACKNGHLRAIALNDAALLTATANDLAYDQVFSLPLERLGREGDLVIAISSSGNSPNIFRALETSRTLGLGAVTLTGMTQANRARRLGDLNFYVPLARYGLTESAHQVLLHHWIDQYLHQFRGGAI